MVLVLFVFSIIIWVRLGPPRHTPPKQAGNKRADRPVETEDYFGGKEEFYKQQTNNKTLKKEQPIQIELSAKELMEKNIKIARKLYPDKTALKSAAAEVQYELGKLSEFLK